MPGISAVYLPLLISITSLIICLAALAYIKSYVKRRTNSQYLKDELLSEIRDEINQLLSAIDDTTERDISLIEERKTQLKSLLAEIDGRLSVYIREFETRKEAQETYVNALPENYGAYMSLGKNRYRAAFPLPVFSVKDEYEAGAKAENETQKQAPGDQIRELLMAGLSPVNIASRLGISIAEVEFAAAIYERSIRER